MVHKREILTAKERRAQEAFLASLAIQKRKTDKPIIIAMVGLVGSGKSSVVKELAGPIGATVIEGDEIRVQLRKQRERYEGARKIAENAAFEVIKQDGNVILDSDFVDAKKRASIREKAQKAGIKLLFAHVYADYDIMVGRVISAKYSNKQGDFFGGASTKWDGNEQSQGATVKLREMWRRTPHHYRWDKAGGGKWILRKLPFSIFGEIDTSHTGKWKVEVEKLAKKILRF